MDDVQSDDLQRAPAARKPTDSCRLWPPGSYKKLCENLLSEGIAPTELGAVLLTHGHADHAGTAAEFLDEGVPVLLGAGDLPLAERGKNPDVRSTGLTARALRPFLP